MYKRHFGFKGFSKIFQFMRITQYWVFGWDFLKFTNLNPRIFRTFVRNFDSCFFLEMIVSPALYLSFTNRFGISSNNNFHQLRINKEITYNVVNNLRNKTNFFGTRNN